MENKSSTTYVNISSYADSIDSTDGNTTVYVDYDHICSGSLCFPEAHICEVIDSLRSLGFNYRLEIDTEEGLYFFNSSDGYISISGYVEPNVK